MSSLSSQTRMFEDEDDRTRRRDGGPTAGVQARNAQRAHAPARKSWYRVKEENSAKIEKHRDCLVMQLSSPECNNIGPRTPRLVAILSLLAQSRLAEPTASSATLSRCRCDRGEREERIGAVKEEGQTAPSGDATDANGGRHSIRFIESEHQPVLESVRYETDLVESEQAHEWSPRDAGNHLLFAARSRAGEQGQVLLNSSQPVEYEQAPGEGWRWFVLPTHDRAAVTAGLILQRGFMNVFPRLGFVMMASSSGIPPGSLSASEYNPTTYVHDDEVGPRLQYHWDSDDAVRAVTDWKVLTLGYDTNHTEDEAALVQVPLGEVLVGVKCNEQTFQSPIPGCRYSLTVTLLPFAIADNVSLAAPMEPGAVHVYALTVGAYDSFNVTLDREVRNASDSGGSPRGLVGAAMLGKSRWSRPTMLDFPRNLSGAPAEVTLDRYAPETEAMIKYQYEQFRADKGLLNLAGCANGDGGCRKPLRPVASSTDLSAGEEEKEKQTLLRQHLFARSLAVGHSYAAFHTGAVAAYVERLCLGTDDNGTYYVTLAADPMESGDGRLSASDGFFATTDSTGVLDPMQGVDATGWRDRVSGETGCWCCEGGVCGQCPDDANPPMCSGLTMPPSSLRMVLGYRMEVSHLHFIDGLVSGDGAYQGCVSYNQWRYYTVTTVGSAQGHVYVHISAPVSAVYAAEARAPTLADHDRVLRPPLSELTLSACDVTQPMTWHVGIYLESQDTAAVPETLFMLTMRTADATALITSDALYTGATCCGGFMHWRVPALPSSQALRVNLSVHSGAVHAVFLQYDSCASFNADAPLSTCSGLCDVGWMTTWDRITDKRSDSSQLVTTVSMGELLTQTDKRRAGTWYIGVKALPDEAAQYEMRISLAAPAHQPPRPHCSHLDRFCATPSQRAAVLPITTAADTRTPELRAPSAASPSARRPHASTLVLAALVSMVASFVSLGCHARSR